MEVISKNISFIILLLTFSGILLTIFKKVFIFVSSYWKKFNEAFDKLDYVYKEVKPNHGSSIYDKITKISESQIATNKELFVQSRLSRQIRDDMIDVMYCEYAANGEFVFANKKFEEVTGLQGEDMRGSGWVNFICEKDRQIVYAGWQEALNTKTPFSASFCLITKDGNEARAHLKMQQIRDTEGNVLYFVGRIYLD